MGRIFVTSAKEVLDSGRERDTGQRAAGAVQLIGARQVHPRVGRQGVRGPGGIVEVVAIAGEQGDEGDRCTPAYRMAEAQTRRVRGAALQSLAGRDVPSMEVGVGRVERQPLGERALDAATLL